jgi:diamine N-acetyltransferase
LNGTIDEGMKQNEITFRLAQTTDLIELRELCISSFVQAYAQFNTEENMRTYLSENFSEEKLSGEINAGLLFVGVSDGEIIAYAKLVSPSSDKIPGRIPLEIARLYTSTKQIGQGTGKQMIEEICREAKSRNCDSVCLDVWQKNYRAINFYQREGFTICGTTRFVLGDDVQDDFVMLRKL